MSEWVCIVRRVLYFATGAAAGWYVIQGEYVTAVLLMAVLSVNAWAQR